MYYFKLACLSLTATSVLVKFIGYYKSGVNLGELYTLSQILDYFYKRIHIIKLFWSTFIHSSKLDHFQSIANIYWWRDIVFRDIYLGEFYLAPGMVDFENSFKIEIEIYRIQNFKTEIEIDIYRISFLGVDFRFR